MTQFLVLLHPSSYLPPQGDESPQLPIWVPSALLIVMFFLKFRQADMPFVLEKTAFFKPFS